MVVKQLVLRLAAAPNRSNGDMTGSEADAYVNAFLDKGWKLVSGTPAPVGRDNEAIQVYYCLATDDPKTAMPAAPSYLG